MADGNDSSHKCLWVALPNAELNKQLRACTQAFAEWTGVDPSMGFKYRDMVAWTAEFAGIASDMDRRSFIQFYFGMQDKPGGLEGPFLLAFAHVEKRAYDSEALFVTALVAGAAKADRSKLEAAALSDDGLHACQASRAADPKEEAITFGKAHTPGMVAVCAPVVADVLFGLTDVRALNSQLLELAAVFPKGQVPTKPAELFTVHGMRALGRLAAAYAVWAADAKTTVVSVDTRADS